MSRHGRVVVIGAGPSGCAAAHEMVQAGLEVLVVEQGSPFKDKVCGDALVSPAVEFVEQYLGGEDTLSRLGGRPFKHIDLVSEGALLWRLPSQDAFGWVVPRARLDQALRDVISRTARLFYDATAREIRPQGEQGMVVHLSSTDGREWQLDADAAVLATGATNHLSREFGVDGVPVGAASVSMYVEGEALDAPALELHPSCRPGYRWAFPLADGIANLGVCLLGEGAGRHLRSLAQAFLEERRPSVPRNRWRGGKGPLWSGRGSRWHHPVGLVSCGDAAGLVDHINGEGITAALFSGAQAARSITRYLEENRNPARLQEYSTWVGGFFGRKYALSSTRQLWSGLCGVSPR